jgi:nitroreductase
VLNYSRLPPAIERILDAAHWAPSGDNAQPWTFAVHDGGNFDVCVRVESGNVYEYRQGEPTLISAGTLLENIAVAAPSHGKRAGWQYQGLADGTHRIRVALQDDPSAGENPLLGEIARRSVDRRPYQLRPLGAQDKQVLSQTLDPEFSLAWHETLADRRAIAALTRLATDIRLRIPETFDIHNKIVDWKRAYSPDAIPSRALGVDAMTLKMMRWTLAKRARTEIANRLGSPFFAGLQMDFLPGIFSAAYFAVRLSQRLPGQEGVCQMLRAGQAVQRFWLMATKLGLVMQPCLATLAFSHYGLTDEPFTVSAAERRKAADLARRTGKALIDLQSTVFLGRIGFPQKAKLESRSIRVPLVQLVRDENPAA